MYILDTRENIFLNLLKQTFNTDFKDMYETINGLHNEFIDILKKKSIQYNSLKNVLIPQNSKKEILLVFDRRLVEGMDYGYKIMEEIISKLDHKSKNSFLIGDFINIIGNEWILRKLINEHIQLGCWDTFFSSQYFFIYINNLSNNQFNNFALNEYSDCGYIGFVDMTYSSRLKDYCSFILGSNFIKMGNEIVMSHEDDRSIDENVNLEGFPFEKYGFVIKSIPEYLYSLFLNYKIERNIVGQDKNDIAYSLNAISKNIGNLSSFNVLLEAKKFEYLKKEKTGTLKRLDALQLSCREFELFLQEKIWSNYIFNLSYEPNHNTCKFNTLLECRTSDDSQQTVIHKVQVSLEYKYDERLLRVITLY